MADNVNVSPSGTTAIATDDIGGVQFQKVKINLGSDGFDDGLVSQSNPLPVSMADVVIRFLMGKLKFLSFDNTSSLRATITNTPPVTISSGTVTTVSTVSAMTIGNMSIGDSGKNASLILMSQTATQPIYSRLR